MSNELQQLENSDSSSPVAESPLLTREQQRRRRPRRSRFRRWYSRIKRRIQFRTTFIFIIVVAFLGLTVLNVQITDAMDKLSSSWRRMESVIRTLNAQQLIDFNFDDFDRINVRVIDLLRQIDTTQSRIAPIQPLLKLNNEWQTSYELLDASYLIALSAQDILRGVEPVVSLMKWGNDQAPRISSGERVIELLELGQGHLENAESHLESAKQELDQIDLTTVSDEHLLNIYQLYDYQQQLTALNSALIASPDIFSQVFGVDGQKTYLILGQNNDEIRPSGGRIEVYGSFSIRNGRITDYAFHPSTESDPRPPGSAFLNTLEVPDWWYRSENSAFIAWDGSWYVDFPSTAQLAMDYYNGGNNPNVPVDGVISVDVQSLETLTSLFGTIKVVDNDRRFNADRTFREIAYDTTAYGDLGPEGYNTYLADIYETMFLKVQEVEQDNMEDLLITILDLLVQRHIMFYLPDETLQSSINQLGWSGALAVPDSNDYLLVADANLVNKSNHSIIRSFTYNVEIQPDMHRMSELNMRYDYFSSLAADDPAVNQEFYGPLNYQSVTQIYLPADSEILEDDNLNQITIVDDENYTHIVSRVEVDYDTSEQFRLAYETPANVDQFSDLQRYRLLIQKQPGSQIQDVNVLVTLPENANLVSVPRFANVSRESGQLVVDYRFSLIADQWLEILYRLDS